MNLQERALGGLHAHALSKTIEIVPSRTARIVDFGCGSGAFLKALQGKRYHSLVGIDINPPADVPDIDFIQADFDSLQLDIPDSSVDLIIAIEVIEHIENIGVVMAELSRVLKPGGKIFITTPNVHSLEARIRYLITGELRQFDAKGDPTHITPIFVFAFNRILERYSLAAARVWGFPEDGSSPSSGVLLRMLAWLARSVGLRREPAGDILCMLLERSTSQWQGFQDNKKHVLTSHYSK